MENERPLLVLKPKFRPIATLLSGIPGQLFLTVWVGGFCGGIIGFFLQAVPFLLGQQSEGTQLAGELLLTCLTPIALFGIITFIGAPTVNYLVKKRAYALTEYRFFSTKLEYYEGFFTVEEKTIDYRFIIEITMRQTPVQRMFGLGNLVLSTPATGTTRGASASGIVLIDLENPENVYHQAQGIWSHRP